MSAGPVYSSSSTTMARFRIHMHRAPSGRPLQSAGKAGVVLFSAADELQRANIFPYTLFGLEPGTQKSDVRRASKTEQGGQWHPNSRSISLCSQGQVGSCAVYSSCAGSLVTYEPQWGSDVFGMYQSARRRPLCAVAGF